MENSMNEFSFDDSETKILKERSFCAVDRQTLRALSIGLNEPGKAMSGMTTDGEKVIFSMEGNVLLAMNAHSKYMTVHAEGSDPHIVALSSQYDFPILIQKVSNGEFAVKLYEYDDDKIIYVKSIAEVELVADKYQKALDAKAKRDKQKKAA